MNLVMILTVPFPFVSRDPEPQASQDVSPLAEAREPIPQKLARLRRGVGEQGVGVGPNRRDGLAGSDEERRRCEGHKGQQQRVLDQVLALFVAKEIQYGV